MPISSPSAVITPLLQDLNFAVAGDVFSVGQSLANELAAANGLQVISRVPRKTRENTKNPGPKRRF